MEPARNRQKLSTKFALTCILPASLLLVAVCCLSIMFTSKNLIHSIKKSMEGQGGSKVETVTDGCIGSVNSSAFPKRASEIKGYLKTGNNDAVCEVLSLLENRSASIERVKLYDFNSGRMFDSESFITFTDSPDWYDEQEFLSGKGYFMANDITFNPKEYMISYVYQFSTDEDDIPDCCFVADFENRQILRTLELSVSVMGSKWMIFDNDGKIIYHSMGYNREVFDAIESLMREHRKDQFTEDFMGSKVVLYENRVQPIDNITLLYVVPVDAIIVESTGSIVLVIILTVVSICILAFFIRLMTRKMVKEIDAVRLSLKNILDRKLTGNIKAETQDEMGLLVDDFNKVINLLTYQAEHDENTGFYNARAFAARASQIVNSEDRKKHYAVIRVDIDNFSFINDIFDWEVGNSILVKIANIIHAVFNDGAIHGYLGNDIFVVLYGFDDMDDMLTRILKTFDSIRECESRIHLVPHFGVSDEVMPDSDISVLCDHAGVALKKIKGNLLKIYEIYDDEFKENHNTQKFVESNKQEALENREFFIQLQPKCNIATGEVVGAESLVRWNISDRKEIMSPGKFVPIFEKNGFIIPLDRYVWEETCKVIKSWHNRGFREIPVSVNVSRMHINNPNFVNELYELVRKYDIRPDLLEIEITESALLQNGDSELEPVMQDLRSRGFRLLMDDFASGYSSLLSLQKLPFDVIKIDKALIDQIEDTDKQKFVSGTVAFLFDLGKEIVVEGVESEEQKKILSKCGCRVVQGFCFSRPLNIDDFEKMAFGI